MFRKMTRRKFLKTAALGFLAVNTIGLLPDGKVFAASDCTVKTRYGTFNGFLDQNGVKTWLGIPYAQPPVGKLRWRAPEPLKPSNKTFDAKKFGFTAIQTIDKHEAASVNPQSEDCLTLNIWTRGEGKNKPVMVFIHGGGFDKFPAGYFLEHSITTFLPQIHDDDCPHKKFHGLFICNYLIIRIFKQ